MGSPPFRTFPPHTWTEQITLAQKFVPLFLIYGNHKADPLCWEKVEQCALACEGKPPTLLMPDTIASFGRTRQAQSQLNGCRACGCALRNKSSILPDETRVRESKSSIKRDVKKKVLPRPEGEKILSRAPAHFTVRVPLDLRERFCF